MRIGWVMGWAVPEAWFAARVRELLPEARHVFVAPTTRAADRLEETGPFDVVAGYSLGAHRLLRECERVRRLAPRVVLFAPVFAFCQEHGLGGRVAGTQVRYLQRWLRRDPQAALTDFYARAGLDIAVEPEADVDVLAEGLAELEHGRVEPPVPEGWESYCGTEDALLDASVLWSCDHTLTAVPGAGHHPAALIAAWKETL